MINSMPTGGDASPYECPNCASPNTLFEEYGSSESDTSELGIICEDCEHVVDPDDMGSLLDEEQ